MSNQTFDELYAEYQEDLEFYNKVQCERTFDELYDLADSLLGQANRLIEKLLAERRRAYERQDYNNYIRG